MARKGKARKVVARKAPSAKDRRRAAVPGREQQGLGRAGRAGGTKSAGGKGARQKGGMHGAGRADWKPAKGPRPTLRSPAPRRGGW